MTSRGGRTRPASWMSESASPAYAIADCGSFAIARLKYSAARASDSGVKRENAIRPWR